MTKTDRKWMYEQYDDRGHLSPIFINGVKAFAEFASSKPSHMDKGRIICPCKNCRNRPFLDVDMVKLHLYKAGFVQNYKCWDGHGETLLDNTLSDADDTYTTLHEQHAPTYTEMILDATDSDCLNGFMSKPIEEEPNTADKKFFDMLKAADKDLWSGCKKATQLSVVSRLLNIKSDYRMPEQCYDTICQLINDVIPEENNMVDSLYNSKKLVQSLGLPVEVQTEIKKCVNTFSYSLEKNAFFPLTPRLKRLYASHATAGSMRWHATNHGHDFGVMCHPSDSEAWKHFDNTYPSFASETRNMRLGLCTDGFTPHGAFGKQYSSWPVIITPYNLPPSMCMKEPYMFLTAVVPGPANPKHRLDVFLQPVIAELKQLWEDGVLTYDVSLKQNFQLRAALMWTISDFPAYAMLSGWSTAGKLACPHCGKHTQAFRLDNGNKISWFDCHRRFLTADHTYRKDKNKFRKNRVETKGPPPRLNGEETLRQIEQLGLVKVTDIKADEVNKARGNFGWKKRSIFWNLPYWTTNLIRHNLDVMHIEKNVFDNFFYTIMDVKPKTKDNASARKDLKLYCRKRKGFSENERPIYALEKRQKKAVCEWVEKLRFPDGYVSNLGRCVDLNACTLFGMKSHDCHVFMQRLMPIAFRETLPKNVWETITELSLFFKTLTATSITIQDMERLESDIPIILCKLETIFIPGVFNSMEHLPVHLPYEARIGGPVQNRWMYQFERNVPRNDDGGDDQGSMKKLLEDLYPDINGHDLVVEVDKHFATWFENHVYFVNGYKFHTDAHSENKASMNSGVCISSEVGDYYGKILEILEVEYPGFPRKSTFVFKCDWYDPTDNVGVKVHKQYKLVDINLKRKFSKFEPFVLAMQPTQVCFMPYPSLKQNNTDWMAVFKVKPRGWTDVGESDHQKDVAFQEDEFVASEIISNTTEAFEYDDSSSNGSDDDTTNDVEGDFDDANNSGDDGIADSESSFEYSTSDNEEEVEEEECDDSD
ncbi:hypothetical protein LXL04_019835 [Taraxacum kok-saghyz]